MQRLLQGENNVSGMAAGELLPLLDPNLSSRALPQFGLWLFTGLLVDGVVLQLCPIALIGRVSVWRDSMEGRCMANLHTEAVVCHRQLQLKEEEGGCANILTPRKASVWGRWPSGGHSVRFRLDSTWSEFSNWRLIFSSSHSLFPIEAPAGHLPLSSLAASHCTLDTVGQRSTWIDS